MISVEDAQERILAGISALPSETVGLEDGLGRVLSADLTAGRDQPPLAVSAMDGYAVRAEDVTKAPATLTVVSEIPAGTVSRRKLSPGEAARIYTGAPLPPGADAILIQEDAEHAGDRVTFSQAATAGRWVRPAGLDFKAGTVGLAAGTRLGPREIGLAAAMNHAWLAVRRRPVVAILSTGDEIKLPGEPLEDHQIVSSNNFSLAAMVRVLGGLPRNLGVALDTRESLVEHLAGARGADLLVTSGGASVGAHDMVQDVLAELGMALDFWKIAMRPGKPLMYGTWDGMPVLGLPGNPVSSLVCGTLFLKPVLARLAGLSQAEPARELAYLGCALDANDQRQDYLRADLHKDSDGRLIAVPFERQDSAMLAALVRAQALAIRPPHAPVAKAGETIEIIRLD